MQLDMKTKIIIGSAVSALALILLGMMIGDFAVLGNLVIIAIFISVGPLLIYKYSRLMHIKAIETQFPNFVRDLAD